MERYGQVCRGEARRFRYGMFGSVSLGFGRAVQVGYGALWRVKARFGKFRRSGQVLVELGQARCVKAVKV